MLKYIFIIWNLEFSTYSIYFRNNMIIDIVHTTYPFVHICYGSQAAYNDWLFIANDSDMISGRHNGNMMQISPGRLR